MINEYLLTPKEEYAGNSDEKENIFSYDPLSRAYYLGRRDGFFRGLALGLAIGIVLIVIFKFS